MNISAVTIFFFARIGVHDFTNTAKSRRQYVYLRRHIHQVVGLECFSLVVLEEFEQSAANHEFGNDINRLFLRADGVELNESGVLEFFHDGGLLEESARCHCAGFQGLDGDSNRTIP